MISCNTVFVNLNLAALFISAAVVLVFFVCWTPFHAQRLMFVIVTLQSGWTKSNGFAHHVLFLASGITLLLHSWGLLSTFFPFLFSLQSNLSKYNTGFLN